MITNREIASLVWLIALFLFAMTSSGIRAQVLKVLQTFVYIAALVWMAAQIALWEKSLLKETVLWFALSGFPLMFKFIEAAKDELFFRRAVFATIRVSVFLEFFVNLSTFSLPIELVLQPVIAVLAIMTAFVDTQPHYARAKHVTETLLVIIGIVLVAATAIDVYSHRGDLDSTGVWRSFALLIWLPLGALPFIYGLALYAQYELAFVRMQFANNRRPPEFKSRLALILGLHVRLHDIHAFVGTWASQVVSAATLREALAHVADFRRLRAQQRAAEQAKQARLARYAGVQGTDSQGKRLDQREFAETKQALLWLASCQMGWYRNPGSRYRQDLVEILGDPLWPGLPKEHGIKMKVRSDGQAWYAWRRTVTGWVFAIGASRGPPDQWLYDGADPPSGYPGADARWGDPPAGTNATNW